MLINYPTLLHTKCRIQFPSPWTWAVLRICFLWREYGGIEDCDFWDCSRHRGLLLGLSQITNALSHEDTQAALQRSPCGMELSLLVKNQQGTRLSTLSMAMWMSYFEANPSATRWLLLSPATWLQSHERLWGRITQLSNSQLPGSEKLWNNICSEILKICLV